MIKTNVNAEELCSMVNFIRNNKKVAHQSDVTMRKADMQHHMSLHDLQLIDLVLFSYCQSQYYLAESRLMHIVNKTSIKLSVFNKIDFKLLSIRNKRRE
jgi:putative NADH-flavin reductase